MFQHLGGKQIILKFAIANVEKSKDDMMCSAAELELFYRYQGGCGVEKNISKAIVSTIEDFNNRIDMITI